MNDFNYETGTASISKSREMSPSYSNDITNSDICQYEQTLYHKNLVTKLQKQQTELLQSTQQLLKAQSKLETAIKQKEKEFTKLQNNCSDLNDEIAIKKKVLFQLNFTIKNHSSLQSNTTNNSANNDTTIKKEANSNDYCSS